MWATQFRHRLTVTFRTSITLAVMIFITALAACLILIQTLTFHAAAREAAAAYMDAASANALSRLEAQVAELSTVVTVLSSNPFLADSDDRSEVGGAVGLFKTALQEMPQADSIYVGYDNGAWLQLRVLGGLDAEQRRILGAPPQAELNINLVRPLPGGALPMRRVFEDNDGNKIEQLDLWNYGYDVRQRAWYRDTLRANRPVVSSPYASFSTGAPLITLSAPLRGKARGVIATDLDLDRFSDLVNAERPGEHGMAVLFDASGALIAHPDLSRLFADAMTHPARRQLPNVKDLTGLVGAVLRGWDGGDRYEGQIGDPEGGNHFFRLRKFSLGQTYAGYLLLIASEDDFVPSVRRLRLKAFALAMIVGACFVPAAWGFGSRMAASLRRVTLQAGRLRMLAAPDTASISSHIAEIHQLGETMGLAQRTIWSFAHFVPKEIVKGIIEGSISTDLGGERRELTILFTDVYNFTSIAEAADPDVLMHQTSRHFTALTEAVLAEGGTVDKFIGDAVMAFWNAPLLQPDHVERACRAALAAKVAGEALNAEFAAEGLPAFIARIGIHVGDVVVGNLGSAERMEYTALGSAVNLAARLEGLNKEYGTAILVSAAVRDRVARRFQFNAIASVIAKGMTQETAVYELVGELRDGA